MNTHELRSALIKGGFRESSYSLEPRDVSEALCLRHEDSHWNVYYSERGLKTGLRSFSSEEEACAHFLAVMMADPTTRKSWKGSNP